MIRLQNVTKRFPNGRGIFHLSLEIPEGEVFGYIGPNGAGKSTTIRTLMGFLRPDAGSAQIHGHNCWKEAAEVQKSVGYLPGEISFLEGMNGLEFLRLLGGMRNEKDTTRRDELIGQLELDVRTPIRKMSKGMKQKVGIVAALMHQPQVLILDEPTSGLDPLMQRIFLELIEEEKQRGTTILMSSHVFPEVERVCDRVGIVKDGHLVAVEDVTRLRSVQRKVFTVQLTDATEVVYLEEAGFHIVRKHGSNIDVEVQGNYDAFIHALSRCHVSGLNTRELSLEQIFMHYYSAQEVL
ncbi:MAG: ABC transporter ATP-binding protein [Firmicutes bacterium]|nr:ABC transporter ATP-binding protein [Bacillota bacterium]